ncbi:MAG: hypothetical protein HDT42_08760 [Ruminococcaceae bacterium]|nr:hypothetical protein [Oscillospiraceae bacterium]
MTNVELQQKVWNNLKGSLDKAAKFEDLVAVSFSLISENNEDIYVVVKDGELLVEPYFYNDCNCVIEASAEIVDKLFSGALTFDKALSDGTAKVQRGDVAKFKALECLVPEKKTKAASKTATKTATKTAAKTSAKEETKPAVKEEVKTPAKEEAKPAAAAPAKTESKPATAKTAAAKSNKKKKK